MTLRSFTLTLLAPAALVLGSAGVAHAGEVSGPSVGQVGTGEATGIWGHARSECSFSGLNADHPGKPLPAGSIRTQSYGSLIHAGVPKAVLPSPGEACNGHLAPIDWSAPGD